MARMRARRVLAASSTALPPMIAPRLAKAPRPNGSSAVSPSATETRSIPAPSVSAAIWAKIVAWPWPCELIPERTKTSPEGSIRMPADSKLTTPETSTPPASPQAIRAPSGRVSTASR